MEISRKSLHYKLLKTFGTSADKNRLDRGIHTTCSYIRAVLLSVISLLWSVFAITFLVSATATLVGCMLAAPIMSLLGVVAEKQSLLAAVYVFGYAGLAAVGITLLVWGFTTLLNKYFFGYEAQRKKTESLIKKSLQDKKNGICTIVSVKD